jgi:hypothetical protein
MPSGGDDYSEQDFMSKSFLESIVRMGDSVRTTFGTILKTTGKIDFVEFCNSQNSYKMLPNPKDIVIFVHLDILSTNRQKLRECYGGETLLKMIFTS